MDDFKKKAAQLFKAKPDYFTDLVAYKIAKHYNDEKLDYWLNDVPQHWTFARATATTSISNFAGNVQFSK